MKRVACVLVIAAFLAAPMLAAAQQAKPAAPAAPAAPAVAPAAPAEPAAPAKPAEPAAPKAKKAPAKKAETVTGMVEVVKDKKGKVTGYTLKTDTETYVLKGKGVKAMVGKKVDATGTVATVKGKKVLTASKIKEAM
jgi:hypothetical protein